ncbi:hypothetical protein ACH40E_38095 [Streptomyces acidicola]|uniref:hypothetical protein n=1 Tax=Streptomyces acidicola TaxID=2596892 RepID=UPI00378A73AC
MRNSLSLLPGIKAKVDDLPALRLSPEGIRALPVVTGPRLAVVGRIGPKCRDCRDFERVVTRNGFATCDNPVHAENKPKQPPLPVRKPGATNPPKPRTALLVG